METIQIADTGQATSSGEAVYTKVDSGNYISIPSGNVRYELDSLSTNFDGRRLDRTLGILSFWGNKVTAIKPMRITLPCLVNNTTEGLEIYAKLQLMQRTLGLKKLKGGLGTISTNPNVNTDGSIYVTIKSLKPTENLKTASNAIYFTVQLEQVI